MKDKPIGTAKLKTYIHITKITIWICWISLFAFWAIKLFGGNFFEIVVQNENFVAFSNMVETTWVKYLVSFFTIGIANYLMIGAICQKFYFKSVQALVVALSIISMWAVANFVPLGKLQFPSWYGYLVLITIGIVYQKGWRKTFGLIAIVFEFVFSTVSLLVRNIPIIIIPNYVLLLVLAIDMYIMTALYYLYSNLIKMKKEI